MRKYKKNSETKDFVTYTYSYEFYTDEYTGLIEINKHTKQAKMIKQAKGELRPEYAVLYAQTCLPEENYPNHRTHTAR